MAKVKIDSAVFTAVGQHYIARPLFFGVDDPMPERSGFLEGESDTIVMPDIPIRKPRQETLASKRRKDSPLSGEVWEMLIEWASDNCPGTGGRHRYWGAMAGFLYRQGVDAEEVSEMVYEAATAANDEEAESRADCALRACDAIDRDQYMTGGPTLVDEFDIKDIDKITKMLGSNKLNLDEAIKALTTNYDTQELNAILREVTDLSPLDQEKRIKQIKDKTKIGATKLEKAMKAIEKEKNSGDAFDFGFAAAQTVLRRNYGGGELLIRSGGRNFTYNGRYWEDEPNDYISGRIIPVAQELLNHVPSDKSVDSIMREGGHLIRCLSTQKGDAMRTLEYPYPIVNTLNAEIWMNHDGSIDVLPHNPDSFQLGCLNVEYDPKATCSLFDDILLETFSLTSDAKNMRRHFYEFGGYVIQPYHDIATFGLWHGVSNGGKSKLAQTLAKLIGDDGVIYMKLEALAEDRDALGNLLGKRLIIEDEMKKGVEFPDGIIKMICELKRITGELKFVNKFSFINYATPLLIGNHWPVVRGADHAIQRRAKVFPFKKTFPDSEDDMGLFPRLWADRQLMSGLLNQFIEGCQRLRARKNRFEQPDDCIRAYQEWVSGNEFVPVFLNEICVPNPDGPNQPWTEHYERFKEWAKIRKINNIPGHKDLKRIYTDLGIQFGGTDGYATVKGIKAPETPM